MALLVLLACGEWSIVDRDSELIASIQVTERLTQEPVGSLDILFVVDGTGSMAEEQVLLASQATTFLDALSGTSDRSTPVVSWQVGVTSMSANDQGMLQGIPWILTPDQENSGELLAAALQVGSNQLPPSEGFACALLALHNEANAGFRRPDAALQLIFLSDSDDQSVAPADSAATTVMDLLLTELNTQQAETGMPARVSAIIGDLPSGCGEALPGTAYAQAATQTAGKVQSICSPDFSQIATALAQDALTQNTRFALQAAPDLAQLSAIRVTLQSPGSDGLAVLTDWEIIEEQGIFYLVLAQAPPAYSTVTITYPITP